jgi:hypothetical protein
MEVAVMAPKTTDKQAFDAFDNLYAYSKQPFQRIRQSSDR